MFARHHNSNCPPQSERRGAATVEMALVLPVFFMVMLGIVEVGRAFMVSQLLTNAAREGSRVAIMTNSTNTEVTNTITDIVQASRLCSRRCLDHDHRYAVSRNPNPGNNVNLAKKARPVRG